MFSLDTLGQMARQCLCRFSVTVGFITMLTAYLLVMAWADKDLISERMNVSVCYYLGVGILLTTVLQLWGEEVKNRRTRLITNVGAHIALLVDAVYLYAVYAHADMEISLAHSSVVMALAVSLFLLPFFREKDDVAAWNFTLRLLFAGFTSWMIGGIMCGGICLLTVAIEQLFGVDLSDKWLYTWSILFLQALPALLFIGRIPAEAEKHDRIPRMSAFLHKSIRYLFLPLLGCYLLVLYGYLAKIIFQWQLPDGWVSKLVSVLTFGSIAVVLGLYPLLRKDSSKTDSRIVRFLPLAILPLLVLMTIGIVRRLSDYGITVNRLYLLTLNIWFYVVCMGLFFSRARRIWWIPASFAAFFLLTSALPVNLVRFTRNWMYERVEAVIKDSYKGPLPMDEKAYRDWIVTLPAEEALQVNSRLRCLAGELKDNSKKILVADSVSWWRMTSYIEGNAGTGKGKSIYYCGKGIVNSVQEIEFNGQYASMLVYSNEHTTVPYTDKTLRVPISKDSQLVDTIEVSMNDLRKWDADDSVCFTVHNLPCRRKDNRFVLTDFTLQSSSAKDSLDFTYSGYYFMYK